MILFYHVFRTRDTQNRKTKYFERTNVGDRLSSLFCGEGRSFCFLANTRKDVKP